VAINSISMHPFTSKVAAGLWNGNIEVYELDNGKRVSQQLGWTRPVKHLEYSLCGNFIFCHFLYRNRFYRYFPQYSGNFIKESDAFLWVSRDNALMKTLFETPLSDYYMSNVTPVPDNRNLVVCSGWKKNFYSDVDLRLLSNYAVALKANHISASSLATSVCFSGKQSLYGVGYKDGRICFYHQSNLKMSTSAHLNDSPVVHLSWIEPWYVKIPLVLVAHQNGSIMIVKVKAKCKVFYKFVGHFGEILAFDGSEECLVSSDNNGLVRIWNLPTSMKERQEIKSFQPIVQLSAHTGACLCVSISEKFLVTGGKDKNLNFYKIKKKTISKSSSVVVVEKAHCNWIMSCSQTIDQIVSACDCEVKVWEYSGQLLYQFRTSSKGRIISISFLPFSEEFLYSTSVGEVFICLKEAEALILKSDSIKTGVLSFAFCKLSDGGEMVVVSYEDGTVRSWILNNTNTLSTFVGHTSPITSIACASQLVASASVDGSVKLWDFNSEQKPKYNLPDSHKSPITYLAKDRDQHIISACSDQVKLWRVTSKKLHLVGTYTLDEWHVPLTVVACNTFENEDGSLMMIVVTQQGRIYTSILGKGSLSFKLDKSFDKEYVFFDGHTFKEKRHLLVNFTDRNFQSNKNYFLDIDQLYASIKDDSLNVESQMKELDYVSIPKDDKNVITAWKGGRFAGTNDGYIVIYSQTSTECSEKFRAHDDQITDISSVDDYVVTSSRDCTLKLWKVSGEVNKRNLKLKQVGQHFSLVSISQVQMLRVSSKQGDSYAIVCGDYSGCVFTVNLLPFGVTQDI